MKINRSKAIRKFLRFYKLVFGLKAPYFVILDGTFLFEAMKYKIDVLDRVKNTLQGEEVKLFVTESALTELRKVGAKAKAALEYAEKCCEVINDDKFLTFGEGASDKLSAMIKTIQDEWVKDPQHKGYRRYFVATQDKTLRKCLSGIAGTPLFYLNNVSFVMEPPSKASKEFNRDVEDAKSALNTTETSIVEKLISGGSNTKKRKRNNVIGQEDESVKGRSKSNGEQATAHNKDNGAQSERVKHKAKAANPLSNRKAEDGSSKQKKKKKAKYTR